jgi:hypothetical protein
MQQEAQTGSHFFVGKQVQWEKGVNLNWKKKRKKGIKTVVHEHSLAPAAIQQRQFFVQIFWR